MGYYTYYSLNLISGPEEEFEKMLKDINEITGLDFSEDNCQEATWYESDKDMLMLSKRYPDLVVSLSGDGECSDDLWETRYRNGESEFNRMDFEPLFFKFGNNDDRMRYVNLVERTAKADLARLISHIIRENGGDIEVRTRTDPESKKPPRVFHLHLDKNKDGEDELTSTASWTLEEHLAVAKALLNKYKLSAI